MKQITCMSKGQPKKTALTNVRAVIVFYNLGFALFMLHKDQLSVDALTSSAIFHKLSVICISTFLCINSEIKSET